MYCSGGVWKSSFMVAKDIDTGGGVHPVLLILISFHSLTCDSTHY